MPLKIEQSGSGEVANRFFRTVFVNERQWALKSRGLNGLVLLMAPLDWASSREEGGIKMELSDFNCTKCGLTQRANIRNDDVIEGIPKSMARSLGAPHVVFKTLICAKWSTTFFAMFVTDLANEVPRRVELIDLARCKPWRRDGDRKVATSTY